MKKRSFPTLGIPFLISALIALVVWAVPRLDVLMKKAADEAAS